MKNLSLSVAITFFLISCCSKDGSSTEKMVSGKVIYVSNEGDDDNSGYGPSNPRFTVTEAINDARAADDYYQGDTIIALSPFPRISK